MINHHVHAAVARERRNALLAETAAARRVKHARLRRQRAGRSVAGRSQPRSPRLGAARPAPSARSTFHEPELHVSTTGA